MSALSRQEHRTSEEKLRTQVGTGRSEPRDATVHSIAEKIRTCHPIPSDCIHVQNALNIAHVPEQAAAAINSKLSYATASMINVQLQCEGIVCIYIYDKYMIRASVGLRLALAGAAVLLGDTCCCCCTLCADKDHYRRRYFTCCCCCALCSAARIQ